MLQEQLEELYDDYDKKRTTRIIRCGVVDEITYAQSKPKVVFVLKEAHSAKSGWSIVEKLRVATQKSDSKLDRKHSPTWMQTGVWAYAVHHGFLDYNQLTKPEYIASGIRSIGMTNLKKTGGGAEAIPSQIKRAAKQDSYLWRKELEIMEPDLIICGRTFTNTRINLGLRQYEPLLNIDGKTYYYSIWEYNNKKIVILNFWHPACRKNRTRILQILEMLIQRLKQIGYFNFEC